jgi:hypothetical protein
MSGGRVKRTWLASQKPAVAIVVPKSRARPLGRVPPQNSSTSIEEAGDKCADLPVRADIDEVVTALADLLFEDLVRFPRPK